MMEARGSTRRPENLGMGEPTMISERNEIRRQFDRRTALRILLTLIVTLSIVGRTEASPPPASLAQVPSTPTASQELAPLDLNDPTIADLIVGQVVETDGQPVAGAKIYLIEADAMTLNPNEVRATTTADGRFRFSAKDMTEIGLDGLPTRRSGLLIACAEGFGPDALVTWSESGLTNRGRVDQTPGKLLTLKLVRGDVPIRGRLLDPQGRPLAGASVELERLYAPLDGDLIGYLGMVNIPGHGPSFDRLFFKTSVLPGVPHRAVTGADGRFRLDGIGRDRIAFLKIRESRIVTTLIQVMTREEPDFRLGPPNAGPWASYIHGADFSFQTSPGRTVKGSVVDDITGQPLVGVMVNNSMKTATPVATDDQGRYSLSGLSPDQPEIEIVATPRPGQPYFWASSPINPLGETTVACPRGLPFRLTIRDEAGRPVEAEVTYSVVLPNAFRTREFGNFNYIPSTSTASRQADGSYLGVALPGPGAVKVKISALAGYRPAHVDPRQFFEPGRTEWNAQEMYSAYGNHDILVTSNGWEYQQDYAAIVLINPAIDSTPLELSATVVADRPRQTTLIDPEGQPVVGATTKGLKYGTQGLPRLRAATFPITGLHPDRSRRIAFLKEDRKLIGFLMARGDGDAPYVVRMQPWAVVTGRIVDPEGKPLTNASSWSNVYLSQDNKREALSRDDPTIGNLPGVRIDQNGQFRIEQLIPGQKYTAEIYSNTGQKLGPVFENLTLKPGEIRELGDVPIKPVQ